MAALQSGNGKVFWSSNKYNSERVCLDAPGEGWSTEKDFGQYVGVEVPTKETFYAIDIQCLSHNEMTSFTL